MEKKAPVLGVTNVLGGTLIQICSLMVGGFTGLFAAVLGFYLVFTGLGEIRSGFDGAGQKGLSLLRIAAIVMLVGSLFDAVPIISLISPGFSLMAFGLEIWGYFTLKSSQTLGANGRAGVGQLVAAMVVGVLFSLFDSIPYLGGYISGFTAIFIILLTFFGWRKVQEDLAFRAA